MSNFFVKIPIIKSFFQHRVQAEVISIIKQQLRMNPISEISEKDIVIAGYPKSGNTWFQNIISGLYFGIDLEYCNYNLVSSLSIDVHNDQYFKRYGERAFFKSHHLPQPNYKKVILLARDGRDVMVSYYHHLRLHENPSLSFDDMLNDKKGVLGFGKWNSHINQWLSNPYKADILLLKYEDMLLDPLYGINQICDFIGIERSDELKNKVIAQSSFQQMQNREIRKGWANYEAQTFGKGLFVRKGESGSYKTEFPPELLSSFEADIEETFKRLGYSL